MRQATLMTAVLCSLFSTPTLAADPASLLKGYAAQARQQAPDFTVFFPRARERLVLPRREPPRITETRWFSKKHDEISVSTFKRPGIGSAANCAACHGDAEKGDFDEDRVPGELAAEA